eukprot:2875109-Karenia_brevis.AAC.1
MMMMMMMMMMLMMLMMVMSTKKISAKEVQREQQHYLSLQQMGPQACLEDTSTLLLIFAACPDTVSGS